MNAQENSDLFIIPSEGGYGDHPCSDYKKLSEADRAATYQKLTRKSDSRRSWKEHWYRFVGKAGDKIASM